jgi:hypothetical protein
LSRGSDPSGYPTKPLASFRINRQLSGWNLPPLMIRAFGAHCQEQTLKAVSARVTPSRLSILPSPSLHTDVGPLYHLAPSLRFRGDEGRCLLGGTDHRRKALLGETLAVFRG